MKKTSLLTPDDLIIKQNIENRKNRYTRKQWRKIVECDFCGALSVNNIHYCIGKIRAQS